ncbi:MAG TPA: hypothetical protein VEQ85_03340, partial [Lacipirellulaceae bacterium]|nr:hypothetical protein [Lacipirellulaceae bacterium]
PGGDPITAAAASAPRLRIDPLEVDPEGLDLSMLVSGDAGDAAALSELPGEAAPARESVGVSSPEGEPAAQPADLPQEEPAAPPAAAEVLLARRYPAIHIEKMPLGRFLHFATALSAVPVSASPQELRLAAASAATAVSVEAADATIVELLAAALKPAGLVPMVEDSHIVLRRAGEDRERELKIPIDDLVDAAGGPTAETIADWVPALVAPAAWQRAGGPGSVVVDGPALHVRQSERVGFETVLLLERYRVARGLPPRSKYPQKLLGALVHTERLLERLAAPATFTFSRPTPLAEVFAYWQQELGVAVLVDWPALAEVRLAPHSRTSVSAAAASWGAGLTAALAPLELDWRIVDGRTIEITSAEKVRSEPQLGIYMLKALPASAGDRSASNAAAADQATMQAHVQKLVAQQGASAGVAFDGAHGVLMVLAPAADQRRLVGWLGAEGFLAAE